MNKKKRFAAALLAIAASMVTLTAATKPNIIIVFNDDMGCRDLGCFGAPKIKTPRVDEMAEEGMRFTDFYVASPVCSASRASLMTGCYHHRVEKFKVKATARKTKGPTLYNLKDDIGESKNVIAQYPEIAKRLKEALESNPNVAPSH